MDDAMKAEKAKKVYDKLCGAIERRNWRYGRNEKELAVQFDVSGDDLPMSFVMIVDAGRQLIRLMSILPFNMREDKRMDGEIAVCAASFGMADGNFNYDIKTGRIIFRMTATFLDSEVGEEMLQYMVSCSCATVDHYNDLFLALNRGDITIAQFVEQA